MNKACSSLIIFAVIMMALLFGCFIVFDNSNSCSSDSVKKATTGCNDEKNYTYDYVAGLYTFKEKNPNIDGEQFNYYYGLYLKENGTFKYVYAMNAQSSVSGNYIIVGDEIHLNYLFNGGNDIGLTATSGEKILKIKDNKIIVDDDAYFAKDGGTKSISLTKEENNNSMNMNEYDLNYIINNFILDNNQTLKNSSCPKYMEVEFYGENIGNGKNIKETLKLHSDGTYVDIYENSDTLSGTYYIENNMIFIGYPSSTMHDGGSYTYEMTNNCSTIIKNSDIKVLTKK